MEKQNGDITGYVIRLIDLEHLVKTEHIIDSAATRYAKEGLKTAHHYNLSVAAVTIKGWGAFSYPVSIVTLHGGKETYYQEHMRAASLNKHTTSQAHRLVYLFWQGGP